MDGFEVERVAKQEVEVAFMTQVGEPVPVEGGFAANDQVLFFEGLQGGKESRHFFGVKVLVKVLFPGVVNHADVHAVGMEVNSAVKFVLLVVEFHFMFFLG